MEEESGPDEEDVKSVLAQESSELFNIISSQTPTILVKLCEMMPSDAGWTMTQQALSSSSLVTEHIKDMLVYFRTAKVAECCNFFQSVCMLCENIPMHLESKLMSVAGYSTLADTQSPDKERVTLRNSDGDTISICGVTEAKPSSPPSEQQLIKRPRIDYWEQYIATVAGVLLRRWEQLREHLVTEVQLENVWVSQRSANRGKDKPDQTPRSAEKGSRTPEPDWDYVFTAPKETLESFLQGCAGKVTILLGQAGSGKTLLMSCLGQQWAHGLGPIPSSNLFVLLEFQQLNLLSATLTLSELLFRHHLPPNGCDGEKKAILDYILSYPEQICWVLDGYDKFYSKIISQEVQKDLFDPEKSLPVADLISGLLNRWILPGCTVVVTCRVRDVADLEGISDKVGQLLGWDHQEIKVYVDNYFKGKGNRILGMHAADLLLSSQHLLAMSSLPALCNLCCICVEHLLLEGKEGGTRGDTEEVTRSETNTNVIEKEVKGGQIPGKMDEKSGSALLPLKQPQIPSTLTQVYLTVLCAFLSRDPDKARRALKPLTTSPPQSPMLITLSQYQYESCELCRLAWRGLEDNKILFLKEDIPQDVLEFSVRIGLLSQVELTREDGMLVNAFCFIHLTVQEFLAALQIMTCNDVSDKHIRKRFSLKTRWTTRSDQRTVFTDSLHLYVCGLASTHCTPALIQLATDAGGTGCRSWIEKRQALILKLLKNLSHNSTLTGPKVLELCHCVQESQDQQLAKQVASTRTILELRNIQLMTNDIDALAFIANSVGDKDFGLDFKACSMESECLEALPRCQYIHCLSFRGRKYGDKFAEKLSFILPEFKTLKKLEFCGTSLTATGAATLASTLQNCPDINKINLTDNILRDNGIRHVADIFDKVPRLVSVMLGQNNSSLEAVVFLIEKMSSCPNMQHIYADGQTDLTITLSQSSDMKKHTKNPEPSISLLNQKWSKAAMQRLTKSFACCPALSVLDLSGSQWDVKTLKTLTQFLPKLVTKKIIMNDSCSSVEGLVTLTSLLSECPAVTELHIRRQSPAQVSIVFSGGRRQSAEEISKILCLSYCGLHPAAGERVWRSLGTFSGLTMMDVSSNRLGNRGLKKLLDVLPHLSNLQTLDVSYNDISMEGVLLLAGALCFNNNLTHIHISDGGSKHVILKFCPDNSDDNQQLKIFRVNNSSLLPSEITALCRALVRCWSHLELDLSESSLSDEAVEKLLAVLPKMVSLQRLNVSNCIISTTGALMLVNLMTHCKRVTSVELRPQGESFIDFKGAERIQPSCRLTHFSLSSDDLKRLLDILLQVPQLSDLDISSSHLQDNGVKCVLDSLPMIKIKGYINLSNNGLTHHGMSDVASTMCACDNISDVKVSLGADERCVIWFGQYGGCEKTLSIQESCLENDHLLRLAEIIPNCPSLIKLKLKHNSLRPEQIEYFVKLLNSSQRGCVVSIEECWIRSLRAVSLVCRCLDVNSNIHAIRVHHTTLHLCLIQSTELTCVSVDSADPEPSVATEKIGLVDCAVVGFQISTMRSIIQRCHLLTELDFSHNSLGKEGAEFLCSVLPSLPNLTSVSIGSREPCVAGAQTLSEALLQSKAIQSFNLSSHVISDKAAQILTKLLPRLKSVSLSHCAWSVTGGLQLVKALGQCVCLEGLCLDTVSLGEDNISYLAQALRKMHSIHSLKLNEITTGTGPPDTDNLLDLLAAMEGLKQMEEIELKGLRMADRGVRCLTKVLRRWTELRKISLSKNDISDQSGDELLEALGSCMNLEELHLSGNCLGDRTAARMALVLPSLTHLTVLDIAENRFGYEGSASLSKVIKCMKSLSKICLTFVGTSQLCAVVASLSFCPVIQDVGLGWNNCGDEVALELAKVLPLCQKLTRIDLESNSVSALGVEALVRALQACPALELIRLWNNKVSATEAESLRLRDRRLNFSST